MRRKEREITDPVTVQAILQAGEHCTLSVTGASGPYAIPMSYGYDWNAEGLKFYFHSALQGKKLDRIAVNDRACVSLVASADVYAEDPEIACTYSSHYRSFVAQGSVVVLEGLDAKAAGLSHLMRHYAPDKTFHFGERECKGVAVLCFHAERWSAKEHKAREVSKQGGVAFGGSPPMATEKP